MKEYGFNESWGLNESCLRKVYEQSAEVDHLPFVQVLACPYKSVSVKSCLQMIRCIPKERRVSLLPDPF